MRHRPSWLRGRRIRIPTMWVRRGLLRVQALIAAVTVGARSGARRAARPAAAFGAFVIIVLLIHHELLAVWTEKAAGPGTRAGEVFALRSGEEETVGRLAGVAVKERVIEEIGRRLERSPWIRKVLSVERVFPDQVRIRYERRRPGVAVEVTGGYVLLGEDLVRLPGLHPRPPAAISIPVLRGVAGAIPAAGRKWDVPAVVRGRDLAELCARAAPLRSLGIVSIDVSDRFGRMVLVSATGCAIHWGRPPGWGGLPELPVEEKLDQLKIVLRYYPRLDGLEACRVYVEGAPTVTLRDTRNARGR